MSEIGKEFEIRVVRNYMPTVVITGSVGTMVTDFDLIPWRGDISKNFLGLAKYAFDDGSEHWYRIYER